jgi:two-component system response regulator PilR (NtrC family)
MSSTTHAFLREIPDMFLLAEAILTKLEDAAQTHPRAFRRTQCKRYRLIHLPGNVRELENVLERALALTSGDAVEVANLHLAQQRTSDGANELQDRLDRVGRGDSMR